MLVKSTAVALMVAVSSTSASVMSYGKESVIKAEPDFGLCIPTMKFEGSLGGRSAADFTFLPTDPLCARGQQEASNPSTSFLRDIVLRAVLTCLPRHHHQPYL